MPKACPPCGAENADDARFCRLCGVAFAAGAPPASVGETPAAPPSTQRANRAPWIAVGGLALALTLAVGVAGWLQIVRSKGTPTFDSAPPPSVLEATRAGPTPAASSSPAAPVAVVPPAALPAPAPPTSDAKPVPVGGAAHDARTTDASGRRAPETTTGGRALPERRGSTPASSAEALGGPADEARARRLPRAPPAERRVVDEDNPATRKTVREQCAGRNPLLTGICEARQCMRAEHAAEATCRRIKAADDRRREQ